MRSLNLWARVVDGGPTVIEAVDIDPDQGGLLVSIRPHRGERRRCGLCGRRSLLYDAGDGRRRWRTPDLASTPTRLEPDRGPRTAATAAGPIRAARPDL